MRDDRLPEMDEKQLKQLIKAYQLVAVKLLARINILVKGYEVRETKKIYNTIDAGGGLAYAPPQDSAHQDKELSSTDIHDLRILKKFESELRALAFDSGKEASWEYLRHMKKVIRDAQKFVKETEKKKEKRRREEEIKKYGKH